ncbi:Rv1355c family protein [Actinomadura hibisca]|uniref:Rv1355c family protein n=1 Tax=Actinomadura hibisca TaxID=68565 RepID=UPI0008365571|nr:Rv1355c family protein [Actinomadura hibisca]
MRSSPVDARSSVVTGRDTWRPVLFDPADPADRRCLERLERAGAILCRYDTLPQQIRQLARSRHPRHARDEVRLDRLAEEILVGLPPDRYGRWVWYPWSARLVRLLPEAEFRELRADRNRNKITQVEQAVLATKRIGVVGLSAGNAAALTLAQEGVGRAFRIADFDLVELSNTNRLRAAVHDLDLPKTVLTARQMFELDPYLDVQVLPEGVDPRSVEDFVRGDGGLDLVVEECDDLHLKVVVREEARRARVPVLMETNDRGMLDVERFDLEPDRPVFHGLLGGVDARDLRGLSTRDKVPYVLALLDAGRISDRMAASLPEIDHTLSSWPQLASGAMLGGAVATEAARRILLGEAVPSGRIYVDPLADLDGDRFLYRRPVPPPAPAAVAPGVPAAPAVPSQPPPSPAGPITTDMVRWVVAMGALAPSPHNAQPWRFVWRAASALIECRHDASRDLPTLDFEHGATWATFGAVTENLRIAAAELGLRTRVLTWPDPGDPDLVCTVHLTPGAASAGHPLAAWLTRRVTNRRRDARRPVDAATLEALTATCTSLGARLQLCVSDGDVARLARLIGAADRVGTLNPAIHRETMPGLRWTPAEAEALPHGIDVATMELSPAELAGLRLVSQSRVVRLLARTGGGAALEEVARDQAAAASAIGLVSVPGLSRDSFFLGGRALQRLWLEASARGLFLQPMTNLPYLLARLERGAGAGFSAAERQELHALGRDYRRLFPPEANHAQVVLFRLGIAGPPTARSLRMPLDQVLRLG